jgi:hypothetical protein
LVKGVQLRPILFGTDDPDLIPRDTAPLYKRLDKVKALMCKKHCRAELPRSYRKQ